jgi:hypothetical protein
MFLGFGTGGHGGDFAPQSDALQDKVASAGATTELGKTSVSAAAWRMARAPKKPVILSGEGNTAESKDLQYPRVFRTEQTVEIKLTRESHD